MPGISSYIRATKVPNVKKPLAIDVSQPWDQWAGLSQGCCNVIIIINLLHFLAQGLEPFAINGIISPESNMKLEEELQERAFCWFFDWEEASLRAMGRGGAVADGHPQRAVALNACWKCQNPQMPDFSEERAGAGVGPARLQDV
ncbi:unnamed protein product [Eretmochelys imbricata]